MAGRDQIRASISALETRMDEIDYGMIRSDDVWHESDHPRDEDGKFTEGSGTSGISAPKLTSTEKSYVSSYTGDAFLTVNKMLREGKEPSGGMVKSLDQAIDKSTIKPQKLFRGLPRTAAKRLFPDGVINKGDVVSDKAFLSTTKSKDIASFSYGLGGVVLEIETTEGQKGLDVSDVTNNPLEKEVLLPRGTKLRVTGIIDSKSSGKPIIVRVTAEK